MAHYHIKILQTQYCKLNADFLKQLSYITPMNHSSRPDPKRIDDVLNTGSLSAILKKAKLLETFNMALTRHLPSNLAGHCQAMNLKNSILVIGVDDAGWLTRLRFEEQNLIDKLQADPKVPNILGIDYKIYYPQV